MCACAKCEKKPPHNRLPVRLSAEGEYIQPMDCKKCGYAWEMPVVEWIYSRVGQDVKFKPPAQRKGKLKDRAVVKSDNSSDGTPYWDVVDLIQFDDPERPDWIRMSYYLRDRNGMLTFGGQTSIAEPIAVWRKVLVDVARQKQWFCNLLKDVVHELGE